MKRKLNDLLIKNATCKPDGRPLNLSDGGGLYLHIKKHCKSWRYNYRFQGKQKTLTIGQYPDIGLSFAREEHEAARQLIAQGFDPTKYKKELKHTRAGHTSGTFEAVAREWHTRQKVGWSNSHTDRVLSYLERDVFPWIGEEPIGDIKRRDVISIMRRVEDRGAGDAARRVRGFISQVYVYAVTMEITENNPAASIDNSTILQPRVKKHFSTMKDPANIGRLLNDIDHYHGSFFVRMALRLSPLVMLRPGELRGAEWSEIDLDKAVWTIPVSRMKAPVHVKKANQSAHVVPLSKQAIEIFKEVYPVSGRFKYVFPNHRGASRPMSENGIRAALRTMGYSNQEITPHGFRSMASSQLNEMHFHPDAIERQLAHKDKNQIRAAYNHADYIDERRFMLQRWADKLDEYKAAARKGA